MRVNYVVSEDFVNYKKPAMFIGVGVCSMKCNIDCGKDVCQNHSLLGSHKDIPNQMIINNYLNNDITKAIVIGGLEPFDDADELYKFVRNFRKLSGDDIVIYTGYTENECLGIDKYNYQYAINQDKLVETFKLITAFDNIVIKFGRYIPDSTPIYSKELGVELVSNNQYAKRYSGGEEIVFLPTSIS